MSGGFYPMYNFNSVEGGAGAANEPPMLPSAATTFSSNRVVKTTRVVVQRKEVVCLHLHQSSKSCYSVLSAVTLRSRLSYTLSPTPC